MLSKPKKNTREEIRGWLIVNDCGEYTIDNSITRALAVYSTKEEAQNQLPVPEENEVWNCEVKPCRIILD